ncbi:N-acetylmuramoyl-L-alanine amidase [Clostridium grantii]|uniref:N-acetylmuramoyl-L-alanine amidase n=1 Tax=Clostridium grantii DSM 8605 TaxID=1121316 RepID=A0A1M5WKB6_9CLOT|nr:N-acetylmuramoyl-L-alanine amidase [Clostridium grantii]SHH88030.1 N-acetylmuramoyl-L-alanine amidase [Clostridium grantii DSM 8605]
MNKKRVFVFAIIIMYMFVVFTVNKSYAATSYTEMPAKSNVDINKKWNITFSFDIDPAVINNNSDILVLDQNNTYISIQRKLINSTTVEISPTYGYESGKTYTLIVRNTVKSSTGINLSNEIRMNFTTSGTSNSSNSSANNGTSSSASKYTICLDPGRAANDIGNEVGQSGVLGKDINLAVALKAGKLLEAQGFKVVYTRTTDSVAWSSSSSISERSKIANDANADLFISIHTNSWSSTAKGYETYYLSSSTSGKELATQIQNEMSLRSDSTNRGISANELNTLKSVNAVAVYTNIGFISNPIEEKTMATSEFQQSTAESIASAVSKYYSEGSKLTIKSVDNINVIVEKGENYSLPTVVETLMSDNSKSTVSVTWDKSSVDTSKSGNYTYIGTISGYSEKITLKLSVNEQISNGEPDSNIPIDDITSLSKVDDFTVRTSVGTSFTLPKYVLATNSKGNIVRTSVIWNNSSVSTSIAGVKIITGKTKVSNKTLSMALIVRPSITKPYLIAIDAGHGGYDPGAIGNAGNQEKNVTLEVSLKLADILVKNGVDVVFTRISDNVPWPSTKSAELQMRCDISNNAKANYFISIHCNSYTSSSTVTGVETYYYSAKAGSQTFANNVNTELYKGINSSNRGVKSSSLYVNKYTDAPAILTELEFLSNPTKELMLKDSIFQGLCAESLASGIMKTIN